MTEQEFEAWKKQKIGKRVLITDKAHPWYGYTGEVKDFEYFSIISKMGMVISLDNGTDCTIFDGKDVKFITR
jgi:hypothetical protein